MDLIPIVKKMLFDLNIDISVIEIEDDKGIMTFNPETQVIEISSPSLIIISRKKGLPLNDYIHVLLCHELGHFKDEKLTNVTKTKEGLMKQFTNGDFSKGLKDEIINLIYCCEVRAWKNGKLFVRKDLMSLFDKMQKEHLDYVKEHEEKHLIYVQELVEEKFKLERELFNI